MRLLHILSVSVLFLLPKAASANAIPVYEQQLFIDTWARLAVVQMGEYGVPASITMAQAIVESGWGQGRVALLGNNYFCIKGNNGWTGPVIQSMDDDTVDNVLVASKFRKYESIEESFIDHSKFLRENPRYRELFQLSPTDYRGWCLGLKAKGYATKSDYAEQLIATIERYALHVYDKAVPEAQIKALGLPFEGVEVFETIEPTAVELIAIAPQVTVHHAPSSPTAAAENSAQPLMKVPGYQLGREQKPATITRPSVEMPATHVRIPLMLPKVTPKFERR